MKFFYHITYMRRLTNYSELTKRYVWLLVIIITIIN